MLLCPSSAPSRALRVAGTSRPIRLLEVDEAVLAEILEDGVHIKATRAGPAVLCTAAATYELKTVETTNALLLVPEGEAARSPALAAATAASHLELVPTPPRFDALDATLEAAALGERHHGEEGASCSHSSSPSSLAHPPTVEALAATTPASPSELCVALAARRAFPCPSGTPGGVRTLEKSYAAALTDWVLAAAAAGGWCLAALPVAAVVSGAAAEAGYAPAVVRAGLAALARPPPALEAVAAVGGGEVGGGGEAAAAGGAPPPPPATPAAALAAGTLPPGAATVALHPDAVRLHVAVTRLFARTPRWAAGVFEGEWAAALPPGVGPAWGALAGEAILDGPPAPGGGGGHPPPALPGARPARVTHFPSAALPADPAARCAALFAARPRWTGPALAAFLAPLASPPGAPAGRTLASMLLAHARASTVGEGAAAVTLYSAR